ncbi:hypothetical protein O3P69_000186 [Scylla paramamosain]|uniref:Uncharacterized protein n=1 Tax=Scylla paramamosain TaxID=85552 RepID=A0AAW0UV10_SCYPA
MINTEDAKEDDRILSLVDTTINVAASSSNTSSSSSMAYTAAEAIGTTRQDDSLSLAICFDRKQKKREVDSFDDEEDDVIEPILAESKKKLKKDNVFEINTATEDNTPSLDSCTLKEKIQVSIIKIDKDKWPEKITGTTILRGIEEGRYKVGHSGTKEDTNGIIHWIKSSPNNLETHLSARPGLVFRSAPSVPNSTVPNNSVPQYSNQPQFYSAPDLLISAPQYPGFTLSRRPFIRSAQDLVSSTQDLLLTPPIKLLRTPAMGRVKIKHLRPKELGTRSRLLQLLAPTVRVTHIIPTADAVIVLTATDKDTDAVFQDDVFHKLSQDNFTAILPSKLKAKRTVICFRLDDLVYQHDAEELRAEVERVQTWEKIQIWIQEVFKFPRSNTVKFTFRSIEMTIQPGNAPNLKDSECAHQIKEETYTSLLTCNTCYAIEDHSTRQCTQPQGFRVCSECSSNEHTF